MSPPASPNSASLSAHQNQLQGDDVELDAASVSSTSSSTVVADYFDYEDDNNDDHHPGARHAPKPPPNPMVDEAKLSRAVVRRNRYFMASCHYFTTAIGGSFLFMLGLAQLCLPLPSVQDGVTLPYQLMIQAVARESQDYLNCTMDAFDAMNVLLNRTVVTEQARIQQISVKNQLTIQQATLVSQGCVNDTNLATRALQAWPLHLPLVNDTTVCTNSDRSQLADILGSGSASNVMMATHNHVSLLFDAYLSSSQESLDRIANYSQALAVYNYDYFVGIKIQATLYLLTNLSTPTLTLPSTNVLPQLTALLQDIINALNDMEGRVQLLTVTLNQYQVSLDNVFANYLALYAAALSLEANIKNLWPSTLRFPDGLKLDLTGISAPDLLKPDIPMPQFASPLPDVNLLVSNFLNQAVQLINQLLEDAASSMESQVQKLLEDLKNQLTLSLSLKNYHPPKYIGSHAGIDNVDGEIQYLHALGASTEQQVLTSLSNIHIALANVSSQAPTTPSHVNTTNPTFADSSTGFDYFDIGIPYLVIPSFLLAIWVVLVRYCYVVEFALQLGHIFKQKQKFEKNVTPDLPDVDFEASDGGDVDESDKKAKKWYGQLGLFAAELVASASPFAVYVGVGLLTPFWIVFFIWSPHVSNSCVHSRNGTVFANDMIYPYLANKAALAGNLYHTKSEFQCQRRRQSVCNTEYADSDLSYRQNENALSASQNAFLNAVGVTDVFDRCIEIDVVDNAFATDCCGLEGYSDGGCDVRQEKDFCPIDDTAFPLTAFLPIGNYLSDQACHNAGTWDFALEDSRFNCDVLQDLCTASQCNGVNQDLLLAVAIHADCKIESYFVRLCQWFFVVLLFRVFIQTFSVLLRNAIKQLFWRSLAPSEFKLSTQINEAGELIKGKSRRERSKYIENALRRYQRSGWIKLFCAFLVFCSFIFVVCYLNHTYSSLDRVLFMK